VKLEAFLQEDYVEDAAFTCTLEESKAEEDAKWFWEAGRMTSSVSVRL
jgi:hypothetical protein